MSRRTNRIFIVSAASGTGKTSLLHGSTRRIPELRLSVSHTTRPPREGEIDGVDYHFVGDVEFDRLLKADGFLEHATVFGHRYGTACSEVERAQQDGKVLVLEIDCQGARQVREKLGGEVTSVFILPPSKDALRKRLRMRGKNTPESIEDRLREADNEMAQAPEFDIQITNDDFDAALHALTDILRPA